MNIKIISTVSNNIATDQRLIKVGGSLQNAGYDFLLIGTKHRGTPDLSHVPFKTKRVPIFFQKNVFFYAELQLCLLIALFKTDKKNSILLANDLDTLLLNYLISKIFNIPLVFDSHEIFSELPSLKPGSIQKKVWQWLEKKLVSRVDAMYTVSDSYAQFFLDKYGVKTKVIRNVPLLKERTKIKEERGEKNEERSKKKIIDENGSIKREKFTSSNILLYQGAINASRGIDKMILAMQYLQNVKLWIVGDGPLLNDYQNLTKSIKVEDKVKFFGRINPKKLKKVTLQATIGLSLEEDNGLSYRYALPNKIFDYIHAGIPVLGSGALPEVKNIIKKYQIGDLIDNHDPKHIAEKIETLLQKDITKFYKGLNQAQKELNWQIQEPVLLSIFKEIMRQKYPNL